MSHTPPPGIRVWRDPDTTGPTRHAWDRDLTARERHTAIGLASGLTCREIATELGLNVKTVDTFRMHIMKKLKLKNNVELCRLLIREGAVKP